MAKKLPFGCDQQGRHPEAAEACTDIGVEEPEDDPLREIIEDTLIASVILTVVACVVLLGIGVWG